MGQIENVIADLENIKDKYHQNWVLPYGSAYVSAHTKFKETLAAQAEWDKMKMELFLAAATIGFGAGMGAMFGKTALSAIAVDQALNVVCNRNMVRTFNTMARISASVPGTFIAGQVWDTVSGKLSEAVKAKVTGMVTGAPVSAGAISEPQIIQNDLLEYVLKIKTATHDMCAFVRDSNLFSIADKDSIAAGVRQSQFFGNAPQSNIVGDRKRASDIMELGFYMVMVMNSDYLEESISGQRATHEYSRTRRLGEVTAMTTAANYRDGVKPTKFEYGLGYASTTSTYIAYDKPGSKILDRINELYMARIGGEFFPNGLFDFDTYGVAEVTRAERTMERLNTMVLGIPR